MKCSICWAFGREDFQSPFLYRFPAAKFRNEPWIAQVLTAYRYQTPVHLHLCSIHFTLSCFYKTPNGRLILKKSALPTQFPSPQEIQMSNGGCCSSRTVNSGAPGPEALPPGPVPIRDNRNLNRQVQVSHIAPSSVAPLSGPPPLVPIHETDSQDVSEVPSINHLPERDCKEGSDDNDALAVEGDAALLPPDRFQFLYDNPVLLQELVLSEKNKSIDDDLSVPMSQTVQVVAMHRFYRMFYDQRIHLRAVSHRVILVVSKEEVETVAGITFDVKELPLADAPSHLLELLHSMDSEECENKYVFLYRNMLFNCWEVVGCLSPFYDPPTSPISIHSLESGHTSPAPVSQIDQSNVIYTPTMSNCGEPQPTDTSLTAEIPLARSPVSSSPPLDKPACENDSVLLQLLTCNPSSIGNLADADDAAVQTTAGAATDVSPQRAPSQNEVGLSRSSQSPEQESDTEQQKQFKKTYTCMYCHKTLDSLKTFKNHTFAHDPSRWHCCSLCDFMTESKRGFRKHTTQYHTRKRARKHKKELETNTKQTSVCFICNQQFDNEETLNSHQLECSTPGLSVFYCPHCKHMTFRVDQMHAHINTYHSGKQSDAQDLSQAIE